MIALTGSLVSGLALIVYLALSCVSWDWLFLLQGGVAAIAGGLGALVGSRSMIPTFGLRKASSFNYFHIDRWSDPEAKSQP